MLGKLIKHEIKGTSRWLLPLFLALLVMTIINKVFLSINSEAVGFVMTTGISMTLYGVIIVAILVMTFIVVTLRFYKNLLTDEGYLMFTLPVTVGQQIVSKLLVALMWSFICGVIIFLSIFILAMGPEIGRFFNETGAVMADISAKGYAGTMILLSIEIFVYAIVGIIAQVLQVYVSIALGQLSEKYKIASAVGAYVVINVVLQIVMSILVIIVAFTGNNSLLDTLFTNMDPMVGVQWFINGLTFLNLVLSGVFFYGCYYLLKNKLNLE